jgi:hypothetical protein
MRILATLIALACAAVPAALSAADQDDHSRREQVREKLLAKYDTNHDGKLDASERAAMKADLAKRREERQERLKKNHPELFAKIDTNGDGKLEPDEIRAWRAQHHHHDGDKRGL